MKNYYRILGLGIDAEYEEIKAAYRILAQRLHPDKGGSEAEFRLIQEAYEILGNPQTKRRYDQDLLDELSATTTTITTTATQSSHYGYLIIAILASIAGVGFAAWAYWQVHSTAQNKILHNVTTSIKPPTPPINHSSAIQPASKQQTSTTSSSQNTTTKTDLAGVYFLLNAGSYSSMDEAQQQQRAIQKLGFKSKLQKINANSEGNTSYNIFLGPYPEQEAAQQIQEKLAQQQIEARLEIVDFR